MARVFRPKLTVGKQSYRSGGSAATLGTALNASLNQVMGNLQAFVNHMDDVSAEILTEVLEPTFQKSQVQCPAETGALRDSGYLETEKFRGGARAEMGYGKGGTPDYAVFVHEMPYAHEAPTKPKFLQDPIDEDYSTIIANLPRLVREAAGT